MAQSGSILRLEGVLDSTVAGELIRCLDAYERQAYPVTLDFSGVTGVHWLAADLLDRGMESISRTKGSVFLLIPGRSVELFSHRNPRPDFWKF